MLHEGHIKFLQACAKFGTLSVGVNSDEFVKEYKKAKPVVPYVSRNVVLSALKFVSCVYKNDGPGHKLIRELRPDVLAIGSDWAKKDYYAQIGLTASALERYGIQLVYLPYTEGISTTRLRESQGWANR